MKKILLIVLLAVITQANDFKLDKFQVDYLNKKNPTLLKKYKEVDNASKGHVKVYAIFAFISKSVPQSTNNSKW